MNDFTSFLKSRKKANLVMVFVNIALFIILEIQGNTEDTQFMLSRGAAWTPLILQGQYWRLFTCMFLHFGFEHLAWNMFSLIFLGDVAESIFGPVRYLIIYIAGGIGGNLLSLWVSLHSGEYAVSAGASGAIFACMGAIFFAALANRRKLGDAGVRRLLMIIVLMVLQGLVDRGVDNAAHIGGLISGFLLASLVRIPHRTDRKTIRKG